MAILPTTAPKLMPRAVPAKVVIAAHEDAYGRLGDKKGSNGKGLLRLIRATALHEGAHAVAHWQFGDEIEFASVMSTEDLNGRCETARRLTGAAT